MLKPASAIRPPPAGSLGHAALFFLLLAAGLPGPAEARDTGPAHNRALSGAQGKTLRQLFQACLDPRLAILLPADRLSRQGPGAPTFDPLWPVRTYLQGEALLLRGESFGAREAFRSLVSWAGADPAEDGWGGSPLAIVALWRWAGLVEADPEDSAGEIGGLLQRADALLPTRFARRLFRYGGLSRMPKMEEEILRLLAILSARRQEGEDARRRLVSYLEVARGAELEPAIQRLTERALAEKGLDRDRIDLMRAKRFYNIRDYGTAARFLRKVAESENRQLAAEASYHLARVLSRQGAEKHRARIISLLEGVLEESRDSGIRQRARYDLAITRNRAGEGNDPEGFRRDLERLIAEHPEGFLLDSALYQLAMEDFRAGDVPASLANFQRLRAFPGRRNDWIESAHFRPALIHYSQKGSANLEKALGLLERLVTEIPNGDLTAAGRFWAGRISEELQRPGRARRHFEHLIENDPFGYYTLRARLHLQYGPKAKTLRHMDAGMRGEIAIRHAGHVPGHISGHISGPIRLLSPYHERLEAALAGGLYPMVLAAEKRFRASFPSRRLERIGMAELDEAHLVPQASVLLALRQVAHAARDSAPDNKNRLETAYAAGQRSGDWELAMTLVSALGETGAREPGYLAVAYPVRYRETLLKYAGKYRVPAHLAYAIMRHESHFHPAALSPVGALGLFQFMPSVFDGLDRAWNLLDESAKPSREAYLMDPDASIGLWMRWFSQRILPRVGGDPFLGIMDHQAGAGNLRKWRKVWAEEGIEDDPELIVESVRFAATRRFLRKVLASWEIAESMDVLGAGR